MCKDYLPKRQAPIKFKDWPRNIRKKLQTALVLIYQLFIIFENNPKQPQKQYPEDSSEFSPEQRKQCLEIYERSEQRIEKLEKKASTLFQTVNILVPLFLAVMAILWKYIQDQTTSISYMLLSFAVMGLLCLFGAIVASLRTNDIKYIQTPGLQTIIDTDSDKLLEYNARRDGYCLLWCAKMNEATSDLRADFLRAGQLLVAFALLLLFLLAVSTLFIEKQQPIKPTTEQTFLETNKEILETTKEINKTVVQCENQLIFMQKSLDSNKEDTATYRKMMHDLDVRMLQLEKRATPAP